jgi:hypothetical protein
MMVLLAAWFLQLPAAASSSSSSSSSPLFPPFLHTSQVISLLPDPTGFVFNRLPRSGILNYRSGSMLQNKLFQLQY